MQFSLKENYNIHKSLSKMFCRSNIEKENKDIKLKENPNINIKEKIQKQEDIFLPKRTYLITVKDYFPRKF